MVVLSFDAGALVVHRCVDFPCVRTDLFLQDEFVLNDVSRVLYP